MNQNDVGCDIINETETLFIKKKMVFIVKLAQVWYITMIKAEWVSDLVSVSVHSVRVSFPTCHATMS